MSSWFASDTAPLVWLGLAIVLLRTSGWWLGLWAVNLTRRLGRTRMIRQFRAGLRERLSAHMPRNLERLRERFPGAAAFLRRRLDPERFHGLPLTMMVAAAALVAYVTAEVVDGVVHGEELVLVDEVVNAILADAANPALIDVFGFVTAFGDLQTLAAVSVTATLFLFADGLPRQAIPLWLTITGAQACTWFGKYGFARPRPEFLHAYTASSPSFPSAHAAGSMAVYAFVAYLVARRLERPRARYEVGFWSAVLILLVGSSRMVLSLHYTSDVILGFSLGAFWFLTGAALLEHLDRRPAGRPTPARGGDS